MICTYLLPTYNRMADKKTEVTSNAGAPESEKVSTGSGVSSESTVDSSDYEVVASG